MHHKLKKYRDFIFGGGIKTKQQRREGEFSHFPGYYCSRYGVNKSDYKCKRSANYKR